MISLIIWIVFGLIVGFLARSLHPGNDPIGCLPTIAIGVAGSFVGGTINWMMDAGQAPYEPSGFLMSILGGVISCAAWRWYILRTSPSGPKNFFTGKTR